MIFKLVCLGEMYRSWFTIYCPMCYLRQNDVVRDSVYVESFFIDKTHSYLLFGIHCCCFWFQRSWRSLLWKWNWYEWRNFTQRHNWSHKTCELFVQRKIYYLSTTLMCSNLQKEATNTFKVWKLPIMQKSESNTEKSTRFILFRIQQQILRWILP